MSSDPCGENVSLPLRNLLNSIRCVADRVRDGESNASDGAFDLSNFRDALNQAVKAVSHEATKLSLAFSKPPLPSPQDVETFSESTMKSVLSLSTVYYWLPKDQGVSLRRQVRDATVEVLEGVGQLVEVILSSPLQSLSQDQLTSTGSVWSACDHFAHLPQDNKAAVLMVLSDQIGVVKDAIEEVEQGPRGNQDTYWSEQDRLLIGPCRGLMMAAAACLKKLTSAVKANGDVTTAQNLAQLDDLADITKEISPGLDDLALCLYPPMDYSGVENNVSKLAALLKKVLEIIRSSHVCGESQLTWVQFLEGAVDHNLQKAQDLIQQDS
uniref:Cyclin-D1-binding protein 1-like N-terminal domain-containing protein n=1 Tax=Gasterosteus aculeatus aculeatus TaxID=481459 RepID=G3NHU1_GASAC